jgi:hypothetical protein
VIGHNQIKLTHRLHVIRAHLLYYESLLDNFKKSVEFVRDTPNCSMVHAQQTGMDKSSVLLEKECHILIEQIERLEKGRQMQNMRVQNVMNLVSKPLIREEGFLEGSQLTLSPGFQPR